MWYKEIIDELTPIYNKTLKINPDLAVDFLNWREKWEPILDEINTDLEYFKEIAIETSRVLQKLGYHSSSGSVKK